MTEIVKLTKEQQLAQLKMEMFRYFEKKCIAADLVGKDDQASLDAKALLLEAMKAGGEYKKLNVDFDALISTYRENRWPKKTEEQLAEEAKEALAEMKAIEKAEEAVRVA